MKFLTLILVLIVAVTFITSTSGSSDDSSEENVLEIQERRGRRIFRPRGGPLIGQRGGRRRKPLCGPSGLRIWSQWGGRGGRRGGRRKCIPRGGRPDRPGGGWRGGPGERPSGGFANPNTELPLGLSDEINRMLNPAVGEREQRSQMSKQTSKETYDNDYN